MGLSGCFADGSAFVEPASGDTDDGQLAQRACEEAAAWTVVEQVLEIDEGSGQAPHSTDDPLRALGEGGHAAGRFRGVAGSGLQLVVGLLCGGQRDGRRGGQITVEQYPGQQRNPVGRVDGPAFVRDDTDGEPGR